MLFPALKENASFRYFTFFYLYLMQGIPAGFALTAIYNYLIGKGVTSEAVGTFVSVVGMPWVVQFIWGPLIDRYQYSVIGHRKHWILLAQVAAFGASLLLLLINNPVRQLSFMSVIFFTHSIFASIQDASVDATAISIVPVEQRGRVNAFMRSGLITGLAFGTAVLSYIMHHFSFHAAVLTQSFTLLFFTVLTFFIKLDKRDPLLPFSSNKEKYLPQKNIPVAEEKNPSVKEVFKDLWAGMTAKYSLYTYIIIFIIYLCFNIFVRSYSYHLIHVLKWPDGDLSILQGSWGSLVTLVILIGGGVLADRIGAGKLQIKIMWGVALFLILFNGLSFLWYHKPLATSGLMIWTLADPLFSVAAFPVLMTLCLPHIEGSQFTAYMALLNFGDVTSAYFTGWALRFVAAPVLGFSCGLIILGAIFFVYKVNRQKLIYARSNNAALTD